MESCLENALPSGEKSGPACDNLQGDSFGTEEGKGVAESIGEHLVTTFQLYEGSTLVWLMAPFCLVYLASLKADTGFRVWPAGKMLMKVVFAGLICMVGAQAFAGGQYLDMVKATDTSRLSTFIMVLLVLELKRTNEGAKSMVQYLFWPLSLLATLAAVSVSLMNQEATESPVNFLLSLGCLCAVTTHSVLSRFPQVEPSESDSDKQPSHPEDNASYLSDLLFGWITGIVWKSFKYGLTEEDVPGVNYVDSCKAVSLEFDKAWAIEEKKSKERRSKLDDGTTEEVSCDEQELNGRSGPSSTLLSPKKEESKDVRGEGRVNVLMVLIRAFGFKYAIRQFVKGIFELTGLSFAIAMESLLHYLQDRDNQPIEKGYMLVTILFIVSTMPHIGHERIWISVIRLNRQLKTALKIAIYKKALRMTNASKKDKTTGEIVSIMAEDCDRLINESNIMFFLFTSPIQVTMALILLYKQIGNATFVGLALLLTLLPLNAWCGKKIAALDKEKTKVQDERVKFMNEIINGIKVLKLYAWEKAFARKVNEIRVKEFNLLKSICQLEASIDFMFRAIPILVRILGYAIFIYSTGLHLDPVKAIVTAHLFGNLNHPFSVMVLIIPNFVKAKYSMTRIDDFLNSPEIPEDAVVVDPEAESAITIKDGTFKWDPSMENPTLKNINLRIPQGSLTAVVGLVGVGKSSLLSAMLGEIEKEKGKVTVKSRAAYVPQEAWILNASFKDNLLFGSEFSHQRYEKVLDACALRQDLKVLTAGDKTEIGEKGINLSGGQKQRVSLARAVYDQADIYLLDDPLSAVDAHVGKHIFNHVIGHQGMLAGKTRVLVTHGIHWLPLVDNVVVLRDGKVSEQGTYKELLTHDGAFAQFLKDALAHERPDMKFIDVKEDKGIQRMKSKVLNRLTSLEAGTPMNESSDSSEDEGKLSDGSKTSKEKKPTIDDIFADIIANQDNGEVTEVSSEEENTAGDTKEGKLIDEEDVEFGNVSSDVYKTYGSRVGWKHFVAFAVIFNILVIGRDYKEIWLGHWSADELLKNDSLSHTPEYQKATLNYIAGFALLGVTEIVAALVYCIYTKVMSLKAANKLHWELLRNILRAPMSFFDTTPAGRILTRFSKDVNTVDHLGNNMRDGIRTCFNVIVKILTICVTTPQVIVILPFIAALFFVIQRLFVPAALQIRRYCTKSSTPVAVHFTETLSGTESVRAYGAQARFTKDMEKRLETHLKNENFHMWLDAWYSFRVNALAAVMVLAISLIVVLDTSYSPPMAALFITWSDDFLHCLKHFLHFCIRTEKDMVSLERLLEFSAKPQEAPWELSEPNEESTSAAVSVKSLPSDTDKNGNKGDSATQWPQSGAVVFDQYKARYRNELDLTLKGVTCAIKCGEKVGVVGRTAAGKSTLMNALFRLIEADDGNIDVDGMNISSLGLHALRRNLTILPQDPVIFGGSLRINLDPVGERSSEELWEALRHAHLKTFVEGLPDQLEYNCGEGGKNLSVGQRQLICLARTLLQKSHILVLDEATAAVDVETDELIQKTIREEFTQCTVLAIAHRLKTIIDYDRILVMEHGTVKEFDTPKNLLADPTSTFYSMAKESNLV
ncbi:hypothetical protein RRG08_018142 [Elysia crispata]|uniref:Multidrug resistance-associated protein 1 n=1 Tax=Elysia crispata TaxID=231223 RepID=A0AAE1E6L5_9GAST|nr:hypothetical protein RRG08_018142 [Elysia crispata]